MALPYGRAFDTVNPLSGALNAYDAVIIDAQAISAQLASRSFRRLTP